MMARRFILLIVFLVIVILCFIVINHNSAVNNNIRVCIINPPVNRADKDCESTGSIDVYNLTDVGVEAGSQIKSLPNGSAVLLSYRAATSILGNSTCTIVFPEPRYVLIYKNMSVILDSTSKDEIRDIISILNNITSYANKFDILKSVSLGGRYFIIGIHLHGKYTRPASNVSASIPIKTIENTSSIMLYLIGADEFEANIKVHVLEGWLSDYAPSTTPAPITFKTIDNAVLEARFHGQYIDMSDFGRNLAAWRVIVDDDSGAHIIPFHIFIAGSNTVFNVSVNDYSFTIKCPS